MLEVLAVECMVMEAPVFVVRVLYVETEIRSGGVNLSMAKCIPSPTVPGI